MTGEVRQRPDRSETLARLVDPRTVLLSSGYQRVLRPLLFAIDGEDAERAHERMLAMLQVVGASRLVHKVVSSTVGRPRAPISVAGITFPGRVGLAAGMDKNGVGLRAWPALGFGHLELGTVTARPQPGNDKPRLVRLRTSRAIINRMGFNNQGAEAMTRRLRKADVWRGNGRLGIPVGVSIGKGKATPLDQAVEDYVSCLRRLAPHADYLAINVSSPNTPGLRTLQDATVLRELVESLVAEARTAVGRGETAIPIFVKLSPDLTKSAIDEVVAVCSAAGAAGLIATNTTLMRDRVAYEDLDRARQAGGLSGAPLFRRSLEVVRHVASSTDLPVIGVGGIASASDAQAMLDAGAALVQVFTGLVYAGPGLIRDINRRSVNSTV